MRGIKAQLLLRKSSFLLLPLKMKVLDQSFEMVPLEEDLADLMDYQVARTPSAQGGSLAIPGDPGTPSPGPGRRSPGCRGSVTPPIPRGVHRLIASPPESDIGHRLPVPSGILPGARGPKTTRGPRPGDARNS